MNILDIIILVVLAYALYSGAREGVILQVCSLLGIVLGLYLGGNYSGAASSLFGITGEYKQLIGYAIVVIASIVAVMIAAYMLRKVLQVAGLGIFDTILGVALSLCKYLLILSILFTVFNGVNGAFKIVSNSDLEKSRLFMPIASLTEWVTPAWDWTQKQIDKI